MTDDNVIELFKPPDVVTIDWEDEISITEDILRILGAIDHPEIREVILEMLDEIGFEGG